MENHRFSERVENLKPSSIRTMMAIAKRLISEGRTVYELNIGQPDIPCIGSFLEGLERKGRTGQINYSPFIGEHFLRETYARYLNHYFDRREESHLVVDTENILVTDGASQALTNTFLTLCNPGDEVLCVEPFFSPYKGFLAISGGVLRTFPTFAEKDFVLPPDEFIERHITPRTRAILFNSPCNPSGKIFTEEEVTRLARLALKHDLYLISDEVYREMILGDHEAFSVLQVKLEADEMERFKHRVITIDSASKSFSLCGARIGFVIARPEIIEKVAFVNAHTVASVSDLLQFAVASAYDTVLSNCRYFIELRQTYRERLEVAMEAIHEFFPGIIAPRPAGAFYLMLQFPDLEDVNDYALYLLEKFNLTNETVAVTPARSFYQTDGRGANEIRLALVVPPDKIRRSIFIMAEAYKSFLHHVGHQTKPSLSSGDRSFPHPGSQFRTIA